MKITNKIIINKSQEAVWKVLAEDFEKADQWMAIVPKSYAKAEGEIVDGAPMAGRICEFSSKADGPIADEAITLFDRDNHTMSLNVVPKNGKIPIAENNVSMTVNSLGNDQSEVVWTSDVRLKTAGKLLYPVLKVGLKKSLDETLEELKYFVEEGIPHPRKQAKLEVVA